MQGPVLRIRDVYPGSRILIFIHPRSKNSNRREGWRKKFVVHFFVAKNITKLKIVLFLNLWRKNLGQFTKNYGTFYPKNCHLVIIGIRDLRSGIRKSLFLISDPGVKKAPDTGSATLTGSIHILAPSPQQSKILIFLWTNQKLITCHPHVLCLTKIFLLKCIKSIPVPGIKHTRFFTQLERESRFATLRLAIQYNQCCGSGSTGSTCFWASWIRILPSLCKNHHAR